MEEGEKDKYLKYFFIIAGIILALSIVFPMIAYCIFGSWQTSGTFGDTFGALNAMFSGITVAGLVITILMQRSELHYQRVEMRETRHEFSVNRITNVIYNQLARYEQAVENLTITADQTTYQGHAAIFYLDSAKQTMIRMVGEEFDEEQVLAERKEKNCTAMKLYAANDVAIAQFALAAYNYISAAKESLYLSDLDISEMNNLKNLLFRNIGFIHLHVLEDIMDKYLENLELSVADGSTFLEECDVDPGKLSKANIFLKSIIKFRNTIITEESLQAVKENWANEFGANA